MSPSRRGLEERFLQVENSIHREIFVVVLSLEIEVVNGQLNAIFTCMIFT
jgi:hypothetical protein